MKEKARGLTPAHQPRVLKVALPTVLALVAFAANSLLCRLALRETQLDPTSFTVLRLSAGALALWGLLSIRRQAVFERGSFRGALALFAYAAAFSFAYVGLSTGTGALLLFGAVQLTMLGAGFARGERFAPKQWLGFALAVVGVGLLLLPGATAPPLGSALLMVTAGVAWGAYSLLGRGQPAPTQATAGNFLRAAPLAVVLGLFMLPQLRWDLQGALYAVTSGAVTSGLGYALWYTALRQLDASRAATVQLAVPVLAAAMGLLVLSEPLHVRFLLAATIVLGGIFLTLRKA